MNGEVSFRFGNGLRVKWEIVNVIMRYTPADLCSAERKYLKYKRKEFTLVLLLYTSHSQPLQVPAGGDVCIFASDKP